MGPTTKLLILTLSLPVFGFGLARASAPSLDEQSKEPGQVETIESTAQDPVGVAGLPGLVGTFVVKQGCAQAHRVASDIEKYPVLIDKVKEVVVLKREPNALVVRYTEGAMGISSTSTMRWTFTDKRRSVSSLVVGKDDSPSYTMLRFEPTRTRPFAVFTLLYLLMSVGYQVLRSPG